MDKSRLEKELEEFGDMAPETVVSAARALIVEHRAALARARAEALDAVARLAEHRASLARRVYAGTDKAPVGDGAADALETLAADIRSGAPAPASIPVEKVREVLASLLREARSSERQSRINSRTWAEARTAVIVIEEAVERLGVDLDAKGEEKPPSGGVDLRSLAACRHGRVWPDKCSQCVRRP